MQAPVKLPAAPDPTQLTCVHCGADCGPHPVLVNDQPFCCTGCASVHALLQTNAACPAAPPRPAQAAEFAYLDAPEILPQLADVMTDAHVRVTLEVPGMHCGACVWALEALYKFDAGIERSEVNLGRKLVVVHYDPRQTQLSTVVALLTRLGYPPRLNLDAAGMAASQADPDSRQLVLRLGVAGFCLGNLMLLSMPDYMTSGEGLAPQYLRLFGWISLALSLPLFFYAGGGYLSSAWRGIKGRYFHIDQPLALGMVAIFVRSAWEITTNTGMGYMDSLAGLIFFLLLGKWFQARSYRSLAFDRDYRAYFPLAVAQVTPMGEVRVPVVRLQPGDRIVVRAGELVPADSTVVQGEAWIDNSFLTGESAPAHVPVGGTVLAGGRQTAGRLVLDVTRAVSQSRLTRLWNHPAFRKAGEQDGSRHERLVHVLSKWFTVGVIAVALAAMGYWAWQGDWGRGINAATAVLIVACPCSLAFAAPFTFGHLTRVLGRNGLYLKHAQTVETLARLRNLVFDKTGTLTPPDAAALKWRGDNLTDRERQLIASVASHSAHPLSQLVEKHLGGLDMLAAEVNEVPGQGLNGLVDGHRVRVGNAAFTDALDVVDGTAVHVQIDGAWRGCFRVQQAWRPGLEGLFDKLRRRYRLRLVSGDSAAEALALGRWFGRDLHFGQTPEDKLVRIQELQTGGPTAMLGDGLNDAGALRQADCGIALTEHTGLFTPGADAILAAEALPKLPRLLGQARQALRTVYLCFGIATVYNLIGTYYAVQGELSPVIAAILMPLISVGNIGIATAVTYVSARQAGLWPAQGSAELR